MPGEENYTPALDNSMIYEVFESLTGWKISEMCESLTGLAAEWIITDARGRHDPHCHFRAPLFHTFLWHTKQFQSEICTHNSYWECECYVGFSSLMPCSRSDYLKTRRGGIIPGLPVCHYSFSYVFALFCIAFAQFYAVQKNLYHVSPFQLEKWPEELRRYAPTKI